MDAAPIPTAVPVKTMPPRRRRGPQTIAADQMHRAVADTRAEAQRTRQAGRRSGLTVFVVLGLLVAGVLVYATRFHAELVDTFEVTRTSSGYAVTAGLRTSGPAVVRHPGGETPVDGSAELNFEIPGSALELGDNPVAIEVVSDGATRVLTLHVMVYYHRLSPPLVPPTRGKLVHLGLEVQPGWTALLNAPGTVTLVDATHLQLSVLPDDAIDATPPGSTVMLPIPFELRAPSGETNTFTERLHLPPPATAGPR